MVAGTEKLVVRVGADLAGFKRGMRQAVSSAKRTAKRLTLAFAGVIATSALVGSKFEQVLTETATVAQAFGKELKALEDKARELGKTTAFTATQAARGMYDLASAGMNTRQIVVSVEDAMKLAGATGSQMEQGTRILAASMKQFGLRAEESRRITDTYAAAITSSQLTMERLTEAMKFAGTTGAALGWTIEETTAAVAQFANLGLEGSMAGTNLRMSMIQLSKQTTKAQQALAQMGLTFQDVNPETYTFGEILETIGKRSMTTKQAVDIFGARAGLNMKRLAEQAANSVGAFSNFVQMLRDSQKEAGRTSEMYSRMMDTFRGQWKILWSAIQELGISVFDVYKDQGKKIFTWLANSVVSLAEMIKRNKDKIMIWILDLFLGIVKVIRISFLPVIANISAIWAYMWENIKTTFGYQWFNEHIIEPLKISYRWIKDKFGVAWEYYFGPQGVVPQAGKFYLETGTEQARKAYEERLKDFEGYGEKLKGLQDKLEKEITNVMEKAAKERAEKGLLPGVVAKGKPKLPGVPPSPLTDIAMGESEKFARKQEFLEKYQELGKTEFEVARLNVERERKLYEKAGVDRIKLEAWAAEERKKIARQEASAKMGYASQAASNMAQTFQMLGEAGMVSSKEAFRMNKVFSIIQATINTYEAITKALATIPPPFNFAVAATVGAMGFAQVAAIKAQKPPSYDAGGISREPGIYYAGVPEAHVPLSAGGKIPVEMTGAGQTVIIHMENPVFQDLDTQRTYMEQIAAVVTTELAPQAVVASYENDERIRKLIRSRS